MIRRICLTTVAFVMLATPAFAAKSKCSAPTEPVIPADAKAASAQEAGQAYKDAVAYIKDSDQYQACLKAAIDDADKQLKDVDPRHDKDGTERKSLTASKAEYTKKGDDNQKDKVKVGNAVNKFLAAYKAAHPK